MSKENLEQFIQQISDSEELQTRIGDEIDTDAFIALGAEHGCEFTAEDLAEHAELSDEELDGVAGGQHPLDPMSLTPRTTPPRDVIKPLTFTIPNEAPMEDRYLRVLHLAQREFF